MKFHFLAALIGTAVAAMLVSTAYAKDAKPPKGFTALFNGKNLDGWHGMPHFDPSKFKAMSKEEQEKQIAEWNKDLKAHWHVENDELVNDGHGVFATTDRDYSDIELLIEYKTAPIADSGI